MLGVVVGRQQGFAALFNNLSNNNSAHAACCDAFVQANAYKMEREVEFLPQVVSRAFKFPLSKLFKNKQQQVEILETKATYMTERKSPLLYLSYPPIAPAVFHQATRPWLLPCSRSHKLFFICFFRFFGSRDVVGSLRWPFSNQTLGSKKPAARHH